jgi:6-phosphogluconolactonase
MWESGSGVINVNPNLVKDATGLYRPATASPLINNAACVIFLAAGSDKAVMLKDVLEGHSQPPYPSQQINPSGRLLWMIDRAAAADLQK